MGAFEQYIKAVLEPLADGDLLEEHVQKVLQSAQEVFGLWAKSQEMASEEEASRVATGRDMVDFARAQGKITAYRECWNKVMFDGRSVEDNTLDPAEAKEADAAYRDKIRELSRQLLSMVEGE